MDVLKMERKRVSKILKTGTLASYYALANLKRVKIICQVMALLNMSQ